MRQTNQTQVTEFLLLGLSDDPHTQKLLFILFLGVYLVTVLANLLLMCLVQADSRLHTPMYFFLCNLSLADLFFYQHRSSGPSPPAIQEEGHFIHTLCSSTSTLPHFWGYTVCLSGSDVL